MKMSRWARGLGLALVVGLGLEGRGTTTSLTMGLVGTETSTGQLKTEYYHLDGTYAGKVYLTDGGATESYGFGGGEIYAGPGGTGKIAVTNSDSSFISTYGLNGVKEGSVALSNPESTSVGLALGANAAGTPEWAVSRQHWSGSGWALAYDLTGNNAFSQLPCNEPSPCEISSADVTAAHPGNEILWAGHYWQGGVGVYIRDSRLGAYGEFKEGFHRYSRRQSVGRCVDRRDEQMGVSGTDRRSHGGG